MTLYPDVQRKAQAEIDQIVGNSRLPIFSDEGALPYVQAIVKEALRWHPVAPLCGFLSVAGILISPVTG
jgi:cytochrome P450